MIKFIRKNFEEAIEKARLEKEECIEAFFNSNSKSIEYELSDKIANWHSIIASKNTRIEMESLKLEKKEFQKSLTR